MRLRYGNYRRAFAVRMISCRENPDRVHVQRVNITYDYGNAIIARPMPYREHRTAKPVWSTRTVRTSYAITVQRLLYIASTICDYRTAITARRIPYGGYGKTITVRRIPYGEYRMVSVVQRTPHGEYRWANTVRYIPYGEIGKDFTLQSVKYTRIPHGDHQ